MQRMRIYLLRASACLLFCVVQMALIGASSAQRVNQYQTSATSTTYAAYGGSVVMSGVRDDYAINIVFPFSFQYDNNTINAGTQLRVCSNGWMQFNGSGSATYRNDVVGNASFTNTIALFSHDQEVATAVYSTTLGSAPSRKFVLDWRGVRWWSNTSPVFNANVIFDEAENSIELVYSAFNLAVNPSSAAGVGLNGAATPSFAYLRYQSSRNTPTSSVKFSLPAYSNLGSMVKSVSFGRVAAWDEAFADIEVTNVGPDLPLSVTTSLSGPPDFAIISSPDVIPVGGTGNIRVRFSPLQARLRTATLSVITSGRDSGTRTVALDGYGVVPVMKVTTLDGQPDPTVLFRKTRTPLSEFIEQSVLVSNTGEGDLTIQRVDIYGDYPEQYRISRPLAPIIPQGTSDTLTLRYIPMMEGSRPAKIDVVSNSIVGESHTMSLLGIGTLPRLTIEPSVVTFDSIPLGDRVCQTIFFKNPGSDTLVIDKSYLAIADSDFSYDAPQSDLVVLPESQQAVDLCFTPTHLGTRIARLRLLTNIPLTFESPERDTSEFYINISGIGVPYGRLAVGHDPAIDSVVMEDRTCSEDTVWNTGAADLTITDAQLSGPDAADFVIEGLTLPTTLRAGESLVYRVCGTPSAHGLRQATVTVTSESNDKPIVKEYPVTIFGATICASAPESLFADRVVLVGDSAKMSISISNCGDIPAAYRLATSEAIYVVGSDVTPTVAPGESVEIEVTFKPTARGANDATLEIAADHMATQTVSLKGVGGGVTMLYDPIDIPITSVGTTSTPFAVSLTNSGNVEWTPGVPSVTGPYSYISGAENPVAAGATATMRFSFSPTAVGPNAGSIAFPAAVPSELPSLSIPLAGEGAAASDVVQESSGYSLGQNYPNPVRGQSRIDYNLPVGGHVSINLLTMEGKVVRMLLSEERPAGRNTLLLRNESLPSGSYIYELVSGDVTLRRILVLER